MAKSRSQKPLCVPQKHLHSRISFLYQAATYLASVQPTVVASTSPNFADPKPSGVSSCPDVCSKKPESPTKEMTTALNKEGGGSYPVLSASSIQDSAPSRQLLSHLYAVSRKAQISLSPKLKHSICKRCHTLLITGSNCHERLENLSRGSRKPWADVMVRRCLTCGTEKRTPIGIMRQARKAERCNEKKSPHESDLHGKTGTGT